MTDNEKLYTEKFVDELTPLLEKEPLYIKTWEERSEYILSLIYSQ